MLNRYNSIEEQKSPFKGRWCTMRTNVKNTYSEKTHEGAPAARTNAEQSLRRSVMACMLWENSFYEDGVDIATRIQELVPSVAPEKVAAMAVEARQDMNLRHAPLWLVCAMAKVQSHRSLVGNTLETVIQRADELSEFLSLYWKDGKTPIASQVKKGLAKAFRKFNAYQLAKYNRDNAIKLRDVLFLVHAKPKDDEQAATWKKLVNGTLEAPDTWEVSLSGGEDKKTSWTRLLSEEKLGALALLRNLRNMSQVNVDEDLIKDALAKANVSRVLPFRFIAAARYAPRFEPDLEKAMFRSLEGKKLSGKTIMLVDVSGSMMGPVSRKSDMDRLDAACGLAMVLREICEDVRTFSFSTDTIEVPPRRGFALRDAINRSQIHGGTYLGAAVTKVSKEKHDRLIVVTDEQSHDRVASPSNKGYMINVASYENGVGYGNWTRITGWSDAIVRYITEMENNNLL